MKRFLVTAVCVLLAHGAWAAQTVYVQSMQAKILTSPDFKAAVVARVERGTPLPLQEETADWVKVRYAHTTGWLPRLLVSDTAPIDEVTLINGDDSAIPGVARRRASAVTTGGATRGFTDDDRRRPSDALMQNYAAVRRMESLKIDAREARQFLNTGLGQ
jgi:hypothetical protein